MYCTTYVVSMPLRLHKHTYICMYSLIIYTYLLLRLYKNDSFIRRGILSHLAAVLQSNLNFEHILCTVQVL